MAALSEIWVKIVHDRRMEYPLSSWKGERHVSVWITLEVRR